MVPRTIPPLQTVHARNLARVRLNGIDVYLGRADAPEVHSRYDATIAAWMANGRRWPPPPTASTLTLGEVLDAFYAFAEGYYLKADQPTASISRVKCARELWRCFILAGRRAAAMPVAELLPRHVLRFREWLCSHPEQRWARKTIMDYARLPENAIGWYLQHGHASPDLVQAIAPVWYALKAVPPMKRKRSPAPGVPAPREGKRRRPATPEAIDAVLGEAEPMLADMIRLQLLTGMRPGELVSLRPSMMRPTMEPEVMACDVHLDETANKMDHHERTRTVYMGPRALEIVRRWSEGQPDDAHVFSASRAAAMFNASRRAQRVVPISPSNDPDARAKRKRQSRKNPKAAPPKNRYLESSYRRAIIRACERAGLPRDQWWSPHQLRHTRATEVANRDRESLTIAQKILGHASITTTMMYVHPDEEPVLRTVRNTG